jgi:hypothetical protein
MAGRYRPLLQRARGPVADELTADEAWPVSVRALATASDLFSASSSTSGLMRRAAAALATAPGAMCMVSLADGDVLRPYVVAHADTGAQRELRRCVAELQSADAQRLWCVDAFSRSVQRTAGSLRMDLNSRALQRLWLPRAFWSYVERVQVQGVLAAALACRGEVRGTLLLWREGSQSAYAPSDQAYVQALAQRLALGL